MFTSWLEIGSSWCVTLHRQRRSNTMTPIRTRRPFRPEFRQDFRDTADIVKLWPIIADVVVATTDIRLVVGPLMSIHSVRPKRSRTMVTWFYGSSIPIANHSIGKSDQCLFNSIFKKRMKAISNYLSNLCTVRWWISNCLNCIDESMLHRLSIVQLTCRWNVNV